MNTGIDIGFVQETYQRMSDQDLIRVATQDAYGLTPEAMEVVKAEIKKRNLDENFNKGLDAQNQTYTREEIDAYCHLLSKLSCPYCGSSSERLNATITGEVISFYYLVNTEKV